MSAVMIRAFDGGPDFPPQSIALPLTTVGLVGSYCVQSLATPMLSDFVAPWSPTPLDRYR